MESANSKPNADSASKENSEVAGSARAKIPKAVGVFSWKVETKAITMTYHRQRVTMLHDHHKVA
jgi:hypothetical protein